MGSPKIGSAMLLRLRADVAVEPKYAEADVDCRLLFIGDRYRQLLRVHPEIVFRLSRPGRPDDVAAFVRESAEIAQYYDVTEEPDGRVSLVMRDEYYAEQTSLDGLNFVLRIMANGRTEDLPLPLDRFAAAGELFPRLSGDFSEAEIRAGLRERLTPEAATWAEDLLGRLDASGHIERLGRPDRNYFLSPPARPRVTFVAHTSVMLQSARSTVLTDPLFRRRFGLPPVAFDVARLKLGAICFSHAHWDHCDVATLLFFDKRTPVVIPKVRRPTIFNPPMAPMLRLIGFTDVREVELWQPTEIDDIELIPVPFHGEQDEPGADIDHYTYVFRTDGLTMYGAVDAFRDTFDDMRASLERVRRDYQPTLAFLPVSEMVYAYRDGGVNGFLRAIDTDLVGRDFQYTAGPDLAVEWVRWLGAPLVVPYATFTFRKTTPAFPVCQFADAMAAAGLGDRLVPLRPLDSLEPSELAGGGGLARRRAFLHRWLRTTARISSADRRLRRHLAYRALRRLVAGVHGATPHHH